MYRSAGKRLLLLRPFCQNWYPRLAQSRFLTSTTIRFSTSTSESQSSQSPNYSELPPSPSSTSTWTQEDSARNHQTSSGTGTGTGTGTRPKVQYQEEQARVLAASLTHVIRLGWTEAAMIAGARAVGVSPSIVGSFSRKEAALVEYFMDECLQNLVDIIDSNEELKTLTPSDRIAKLVKLRLEMQAPYISKWPQALSIQAQPLNVPTSFKQRAMLVDEIWHAAGDNATDINWYVKRTVLGGIYSTTELYMLTDNSPDFCDTWAFLDGRVRDALDFEKTVQEVKYLAEAVGAGVGSSLQQFTTKVFQR